MQDTSVRVYVDGLGSIMVSDALATRIRKLGRFTHASGYLSTWIQTNPKTQVQRFINDKLLSQVKAFKDMQTVQV